MKKVLVAGTVLLMTAACVNQNLGNIYSSSLSSSLGQPNPQPTNPPSPGPTPPPSPPPPAPPSPAIEPALPYTGVITSFPLLPDNRIPYSSVGSSKHTNMSSDGKRIYVSGGDWLHSATDGTWSMNLADGSWRQDVGEPIYSTLPAPHALQDGAGFVWVEKYKKFLLWPGSYYPYGCPYVFTDPRCLTTTPLINYSRGMWWFDPATNTYQQELGLFGTVGSTTQNLFGGIYDDVKEQILVFGDSGGGGFKATVWDVARLQQLADIPFNLARLSGYPAAYFTRGQHVKIGRQVYIVGYRTDGGSAFSPLLLRWNLDSNTMEELKGPPVPGMIDKEIRMGTSHGKLVWPLTTGPDGVIKGIYIYDPTTEKWYLDNQVPSYGNFVGNSVTSLPDGRVVWAGSSFGPQSTHIWFYEAP